MASNKAFDDEIKAFNLITKQLGEVAKVFQAPMGADAGFPDFGYTVSIGTKKIDLHIEYKNSPTAQMGSMRDWKFDGNKFYTPDSANEMKDELIELMNGTPVAKKNGQRLLNDLKKHFHKDVKEISSGCLSVVKDKMTRYALTKNFAENTANYTVASVQDSTMGMKIVTHYKKKFSKSRNSARADGHICIMFIKDLMWIVDTHASVTDKDIETISLLLGAKSTIKQLPTLTAQLEVRIQPRGLQSKGAKPTSIDVMANFRLKGKPSNGTKVI